MAGHVHRHAGSIDQHDPIQHKADQAIHHGLSCVPSVPLEQEPLGAELLGFRMTWVVPDDRYFASRSCFEEPGDVLEVDASRADVVRQSEIVTLAALRQKALFDHDVRDDSVGTWITLWCPVWILDDVDTD